MVVRALNRSTRAIYTAGHPRKPAKRPISGPVHLPNPVDALPKVMDAVRKVIDGVPEVTDPVWKVIDGVPKVIDPVPKAIDAVPKVIGVVRKVIGAVPGTKRPFRRPKGTFAFPITP